MKSLSSMTKAELIAVIASKDNELAALRRAESVAAVTLANAVSSPTKPAVSKSRALATFFRMDDAAELASRTAKALKAAGRFVSPRVSRMTAPNGRQVFLVSIGG